MGVFDQMNQGALGSMGGGGGGGDGKYNGAWNHVASMFGVKFQDTNMASMVDTQGFTSGKAHGPGSMFFDTKNGKPNFIEKLFASIREHKASQGIEISAPASGGSDLVGAPMGGSGRRGGGGGPSVG